MLTSAIEGAQPEERVYTEDEVLQAARSGHAAEMFNYESDSYSGPEQIDFSLGFIELMILVGLDLLIIVAAICKGGSFIFTLQPRQIMTTLS